MGIRITPSFKFGAKQEFVFYLEILKSLEESFDDLKLDLL